MENKHEELIKKIAEEMAQAKHGELYLKAKEPTTDYFMPAARIAVNFAADTLIEYAYGGDKVNYLTYQEGKEDFDKILIDMGLIPEPKNDKDDGQACEKCGSKSIETDDRYTWMCMDCKHSIIL